MSISGTHTTPHIGGIATLLLLSLHFSRVADIVTKITIKSSAYFNESAKGLQFDDWTERNESRVHEIELIWNLLHTMSY